MVCQCSQSGSLFLFVSSKRLSIYTGTEDIGVASAPRVVLMLIKPRDQTLGTYIPVRVVYDSIVQYCTNLCVRSWSSFMPCTF